MTTNSSIIDTYPSFLQAVRVEGPTTIEEWLRCWTEKYMVHWPRLFEMQTMDYMEQGEDWRQVAREMVFPGMNDKLPAIERTYHQLSQIIEPIEAKARHSLGFSGYAIYVLHVGIGNGAGWVTEYGGRPAVLFGLEGIVDSGFDTPPARLEGLVAHELGHIVHHSWRRSKGLSLGSGPWWQLYEEGFAQRYESEILATDSWHMMTAAPSDDWLAWCRQNRAWLAAEFLRAVDGGESIRPFFGSWYDVRGRKQTGYFLGHEVIDHLAATMSMLEIALLDPEDSLELTMRGVLKALAGLLP